MTSKKELIKKLAFYTGFLCMFINLRCADNPAFEIIYFSNLNGNIEACDCYDEKLGGLHHINSVIENLKRHNPNLIVIDGGDTFNTYPFIELDQAILDAYKIIKPDIWVPGEQEFIEGNSFLKNAISALPSSFITGNISLKDTSTSSQKKFNFQNKKIVITSYIQPEILEVFNPNLNVTYEPSKLDKIVENLESDNFNILVFHADEMELQKQVNLISKFDLLLTSHQQSVNIDLQSKPAVIGGGADGEYMVHISLQRNAKDFKISASKINVTQSTNPDQRIADIISAYRKEIGFTD